MTRVIEISDATYAELETYARWRMEDIDSVADDLLTLVIEQETERAWADQTRRAIESTP